jgi:cell division protein ZapA (FtsZ GTPase activity inhibitor)
MALLLKILTDLRAALALACLGLGASWYADHARLSSRLLVAEDKAQHETLRAAAYQAANFGYLQKIGEQEVRIAGLILDGQNLSAELSKKARRFDAENAELRRKLAELPALPQECEPALREVARQIQGMVRR